MREDQAVYAVSSAWDRRFMAMARLVAGWSKDPSTGCGAVIVDDKRRIVSTGYNGFPAGCEDSPVILADREHRLSRTIHSEVNAILFARRDLTGCSLYVWPMPPCVRCATLIAQSGIARVVSPPACDDLLMRWGGSIAAARRIFGECGVEVVECGLSGGDDGDQD